MTSTTYRAFFADGERDFCLSADMLIELERKTGAGIGALSRRVFAGDFRHADLIETIRLALIGAGETPETADRLVKVYAAGQPLNGAHALATAVLESLWFGRTKEGEPDAD